MRNQSVTILCVLAGVIMLWVALEQISGPPFFSTHSPDSTYTANLYGQKERPRFFTVEVEMEVLKNGTAFMPRDVIHAGDFMDISFELAYPDHEWIGNRVLHLYDKEEFAADVLQEISLINESGKDVRHLEIRSGDRYFLFDLNPGENLRLSAPPPKGDFASVWIGGEFEGGEQFSSGGTLRVKDKKHLPLFSIFIASDGVNIEAN